MTAYLTDRLHDGSRTNLDTKDLFCWSYLSVPIPEFAVGSRAGKLQGGHRLVMACLVGLLLCSLNHPITALQSPFFLDSAGANTSDPKDQKKDLLKSNL